MNQEKICLFTAHSPMVGGGGVIIRSLVANLPEFNIGWHYIADKVVPGYEAGYMGKGINGEGIVKEMIHSYQMLSGANCAVINDIVSGLLAMDCDMYWIVSHNEGLRVAVELARLQKKRPVHVTFHDDWAGALCARSFRYRLMQGQALRLTVKALQQVSSFDVISRGMQSYYKTISGIEGDICHRYLDAASVAAVTKVNPAQPGELTAGHIGSIYDKGDLIRFLGMFVEYGRNKGKISRMNMWGSHLNSNDMPEHLQDNIIFHKDLPEAKIIPMLSGCAFVYSMYPFASRLKMFAQTSLPTKLTSYVQAGRPIFGHGPVDSTLAEFLDSTNTGILWSSKDKIEGMIVLEKLLTLHPRSEQWQTARQKYFGEKNLATMRQVFSPVH
jgi:hypothetical protein